MTRATTSQSQAILSTIDPATAKRHLTDWLRDVHALESQAIEIMERQLDRLQNYPELIARLRQHLQKTHRQRDTVAQYLNRLGSDASTLKEVFNQVHRQPAAADAHLHLRRGAEGRAGGLRPGGLRDRLVQVEHRGGRGGRRGGILAEEEAMLHWLDQHVASLTQQYVARSASMSDSEAKR